MQNKAQGQSGTEAQRNTRQEAVGNEAIVIQIQGTKAQGHKEIQANRPFLY